MSKNIGVIAMCNVFHNKNGSHLGNGSHLEKMSVARIPVQYEAKNPLKKLMERIAVS